VRDANGTAVSNATVTLGGGGKNATKNTTTDAGGAYRLEGVPIGVYDLNVTASNRTAIVRMRVRQDEHVEVSLPAQGMVDSEHESVGFIRLWLQVCGGLLLGLCLVTLLGTIACYRRRAWGLAVAGAITGSLLWLPLSLLLGIIALVLLLKGRSEFA
jgi:hypothetical protein